MCISQIPASACGLSILPHRRLRVLTAILQEERLFLLLLLVCEVQQNRALTVRVLVLQEYGVTSCHNLQIIEKDVRHTKNALNVGFRVAS